MEFDYYTEVSNAIEDYIKNNVNLSDYKDSTDLQQALYGECFFNNSITGYGKKAYLENNDIAGVYLRYNATIFIDACYKFGYRPIEILKYDELFCDVLIRCYVLKKCLKDVALMVDNDKNIW